MLMIKHRFQIEMFLPIYLRPEPARLALAGMERRDLTAARKPDWPGDGADLSAPHSRVS